ncbi:MoaD family protein [Candidatus Korarchaeum cryptofilum OPF8]|jgi:molybdopterin synthase sulfur carrier subunit|uniref:MoaD family protein n=2 Tax=Candidatus Korarchaeum cryptofilum TaxID=498846 RepID=B1L4Z5_KORCO|nr:MoaD family protein [Candidatus Korarchaeum cryptofilum OPF8]
MNISEGRLYEAMVEVRVYLTLREKLGWKSKTLSLGRNKVKFSELLDELKDLKGVLEDFGYENFMILLNGRNIRLLDWLDTEVEEGDSIDIFPPAGGG